MTWIGIAGVAPVAAAIGGLVGASLPKTERTLAAARSRSTFSGIAAARSEAPNVVDFGRRVRP